MATRTVVTRSMSCIPAHLMHVTELVGIVPEPHRAFDLVHPVELTVDAQDVFDSWGIPELDGQHPEWKVLFVRSRECRLLVPGHWRIVVKYGLR